jgi:hypothetical protein
MHEEQDFLTEEDKNFKAVARTGLLLPTETAEKINNSPKEKALGIISNLKEELDGAIKNPGVVSVVSAGVLAMAAGAVSFESNQYLGIGLSVLGSSLAAGAINSYRRGRNGSE